VGADELVVVGAINVDLVVVASRLPGPGETVVGPGVERHGGGKGANAAIAAARAGASVHLIAAIGDDDTGDAAIEELHDDHVATDHVVRLAGTPTGVALIVVDHDGENQIAVGAGANAALTADHVRSAMGALLPTAGCVLVSTEIPDDAIEAAVRAADDAGVPCVLNPAPVVPAVEHVLGSGPIVTPNRTELIDLADGDSSGAADTTGAAVQLGERTGAPVIVTLGGDGALVVPVDGAPSMVPAHAVEVRDTTGAGDTFNGVLAAAIAAGRPLTEAVADAMAAAALSVGAVGARAGMPDATAIAAMRAQ
jgi:ribokinase